MEIERSKKLVIDSPNSNTPTSEPHPKVNNRANKLPDCQRAVSGCTEIVDEVVEVRADRLSAKSSAGLVQKDGGQAATVMRSCRRHLDVATNDSLHEIIPSSA